MIGAGHRLEDIKRYTLAQCRVYMRAIGRQKDIDLRERILAARSAWADGAALEQLLGNRDGK